MSANLEVEVARIDERVSDLEEWRVRQNGLLAEIQKDLRRLREDWGRRPTWAVTVLISLLSSACVGMALYIITGR
ncbi:MAG: hypothetical protein AB1609_20850 [Bacillota bacterium]